jgi:hypothetical protein
LKHHHLPARFRTFILVFAGTWLVVLSGHAQVNGHQPYFSLSYFGVLGTHPGVKIGWSYPLATINQDPTGDQMTQLTGGANVVIYFHRRNHLGVGIYPELSIRHRRAEGISAALSAGAGYLRAFRTARQYADKHATPRRWMGQSFFLKTAALGVGGNTGRSLRDNFWMIQPSLLQLSPFGTGSQINFALDAGYYFK